MSKAMTLVGMVVAVILMLVFGVDLATGLFFGAPSSLMNIGILIASAILAYLSFSTFRELH